MEANQSVALLEQALRIMPNNIKVFYNLGTLYYQLRQYNKAIPVYQKLTKLSSSDPTPYFYLGDSYYNSGNKKKAYSNYMTFSKMSRGVKNRTDGEWRRMQAVSGQRIRELAPLYEK